MKLLKILPLLLTFSCIDMLTEETTHYNSIYFEGGSWIEIDRMDNMRLDPQSNEFTLQFWVSGSDVYANEGPAFFSLIDPQGTVKLALFRDSGNTARITTIVNSSTIHRESSVLDWSNSDTFYLLSILFSNSRGIRVMINDESQPILEDPSNLVDVSDTKLMFGTNANANRLPLENFWYGYFDEIRLWNSMLTDSTIKFQYEHPDKFSEHYRYTELDDNGEIVKRQTYLDSLIGIWRFNVSEPTAIIEDQSGYGHNGSLYAKPNFSVTFSEKGVQ